MFILVFTYILSEFPGKLSDESSKIKPEAAAEGPMSSAKPSENLRIDEQNSNRAGTTKDRRKQWLNCIEDSAIR